MKHRAVYWSRHSLLQYLAVGGLWEAEVVQFVQQLVHDDEVVPQALLLQFLEVVFEHLAPSDQI